MCLLKAILLALILLPSCAPTLCAGEAPAPIVQEKPAGMAEIKEGIHKVQLEIRRARYALRKAQKGKDEKGVRLAEDRISSAKGKLKELRSALRRKMLEGKE
jgi:hypothetical protein